MKRIAKAMITACLAAVLMIPSFAFAATHDTVEDVSSDTGTVLIGKVLTVNQNNKFPNINDFNFKIEPVLAWDNANVKSNESGKDIETADMPMPSAVTTAHQTVTTSGSQSTVVVGDFKGAANTTVADTQTEKYRATPVSIKFTKAGYYMYVVTETGSTPADVPGVYYDPNSYYIVFYVCNKTDSRGNTIDGVYVHDITSFRNDPGSDDQPDFEDIQNVTDNGGTAALENAYENFAKVGKSTSAKPNQLEAYRFWNDQTTHDVVITKNVTGNLGDRTKEFEMTVTLTGLEKNVTYTTNVQAEYKTTQNQTSEGADIVSATVGTVNTTQKTFTSDASGNATFLIRLKDDEVLVLNALPATSTYMVEEHATDHIASYAVTSTSDTAVIAQASDANSKDQTALATEIETVDDVSNVNGRANSDHDDGTVTIAYTNHRNLVTITGIPYYGDFVTVLGGMLLIGGILFLVIRKRRSSGVEEE